MDLHKFALSTKNVAKVQKYEELIWGKHGKCHIYSPIYTLYKMAPKCDIYHDCPRFAPSFWMYFSDIITDNQISANPT